MERRKFIKNAAAFVTLPLLLNGQAIQVLGANSGINLEQTKGRALVLIQLDGGNDGLNTLIPLNMYDNLVKVRPHVVLPENKILSLNDLQGVHPSMSGVKELFEEEKMMFIQNVGYPQPNLSHFRSKEILLSASDSKSNVESGWFGRYLELLHPEYPENYPDNTNPHPLAISIGGSSSPTCQGDMTNLGIVLQNLNTSYESQSGDTSYPDTPYGYELEYVTKVMLSTEKYLEVVSEVSELSESSSQLWPEAKANSLADKLKIVARLIAGGLTTPIYIVNLGGFDTHASQVVAGETHTGKHADLLQKVSEASLAFQDELKQYGKEDDVLSLIYSEFGRRVGSNKSDGTDHGAAFPMMLFGSQVNPSVFGENPIIPEEVEKKTNVKMKVDFRSVYASILHHWFDVDDSEIKNILFNEFEILPILKSSVDVSELNNKSEELKLLPVYPNPIKNTSEIQFSSVDGRVSLKLYSLSGQLVKVLMDKSVTEGNQSLIFSRDGLANGNYLLVLQNKNTKDSQIISLQ